MKQEYLVSIPACIEAIYDHRADPEKPSWYREDYHWKVRHTVIPLRKYTVKDGTRLLSIDDQISRANAYYRWIYALCRGHGQPPRPPHPPPHVEDPHGQQVEGALLASHHGWLPAQHVLKALCMRHLRHPQHPPPLQALPHCRGCAHTAVLQLHPCRKGPVPCMDGHATTAFSKDHLAIHACA